MTMDETDSNPLVLSPNEAAAVSLLPGSGARVSGYSPGSEPAPANLLLLPDELQSATRVQRSMLPSHFPAPQGWEASGFCFAAGPVGGDFFDVQQLPGHRMSFLVADVMGKGIPAALMASVFRTVARSVALTAEGPAEILDRVNELVYEDLSNADMFVTAQSLWLDVRQHTLAVASAGHCPLLARGKDTRVKTLNPAGIPIGVSPCATYRQELLDLESLESALMYTDGISEARNKAGELFGASRIEKWLLRAKSGPVELLKDQFLAYLRSFESGARPRDDQTLLLLTRSADFNA